MNTNACGHVPQTFAKPKAKKCKECDVNFHEIGIRVCLACGHVGCCESDPQQHALKHAQASGHQVIASYPADKNSFVWCYAHNDYVEKTKD